MLRAFRYGVPPHGGIAFGLDRLNIVNRSYESTLAFLCLSVETGAVDTDHTANLSITL